MAPEMLPPLPEAVRAALPAEVQAYLAVLEQRLAELEARPPTPPSGRSRGGQPGHEGRSRLVLEPQAVDGVADHWPRECPDCRAALEAAGEVGQPERRQVWELPAGRAVVTEHRLHAVRCPRCRKVVRAERPADGAVGACGPRLTATVGLLHGRYRVSAREVAALVEALWGVPLSLGSVAALWTRVGTALEEAHAEARRALDQASAANLDETSWRRGGAKRWLWAAATPALSVFRVAPSRAAAELAPLLGADFGGVVGSDRSRAYDPLPLERRAALAEEQALFARWHRFRAGELTRAALREEAAPLQARFKALLEQGLEQGPTRGFCRELLRLWPALWTFLEVEGVEPTNNAAERALRPAVLWCKGSFGTQSDAGDRFAERILTVAATCQRQGRDLLDYLAAAVTAHATGAPAPALLPAR